MDELGQAIARLAATHIRKQEERPGDTVGSDGIPVCGVCGEPRRRYIEYQGQKILVTRMCRCDRENEEKEQKREQMEKYSEEISARRRWSLMDASVANATFENWKVIPENEKNYKKCVDFATNFEEYESQNIGMLMWGDVGRGKSYAAACIANELMKRGVSVAMTSLVRILSIASDDEAFKAVMTRVQEARLLVLDDLGAERKTDYGVERVYDVIDTRYRAKKPLIITTNLLFEDMKNEANPRYSRIYDRIFEMCVPIQFGGKSFRTMDANERYRYMRKRWSEAGV